MKSIRYGLTYPEGTDKPRDMPAHFKQIVESIAAALDSFNYNGADPNLVLSRVAALEAQRRQSGHHPYSGSSGGSSNGWTWTEVIQATFPKPFPVGVTPVVTANAVSGDHLLNVTITAVTNTGFSFRVMRLASAPVAGTLHWKAEVL